MFIILAVIMPKTLKKNGSHFILIGKNSASVKNKWSDKIKMELFQKSVPTPIKKSLVVKPMKILPTANKIKGKIIKSSDSCILFKIIRLPL